ncbi:MAG: amidohydrolase family protein [Thermoanaerobaculia bacterium]
MIWKIRAVTPRRGASLFPFPLVVLAAVGALATGASDAGRAAIPGPPSDVARLPAVVALTHLRIVAGPGNVVPSGTLLLRDGQISAAGAGVAIPPDAWVRDASGLTAYPGLIELYDVRPAAGLVDSGARGEDGNPAVRPARDVLPLADDAEANRKLRDAGFTTSLIAAKEGILRGQSVLATLASGEASSRVLIQGFSQTVSLHPRESGYPESTMGAVALTRQTFSDAVWYGAAQEAHSHHPGEPRPVWSAELAALGRAAHGAEPVIFESDDPMSSLRAAALAKELGLTAWIVGNGREYERLGELQKSGLPQLLPLNFPKAPERAKDGGAEPELDVLRRWDRAPANPAALIASGLPVAFTTFKLDDPKSIYKAIAEAMKRGLTADQALAALTATPARLLGMQDRLGTLAPGRIASFVLVEGDLFVETPKIREVWIEGRRFDLDDKKDTEKKDSEKKDADKKDADKNDAEKKEAATKESAPAGAAANPLSATSGVTGVAAGSSPTTAAVDPVSAWQSATPEQPTSLVLRHTTLWTSGPQGTLSDSDLLIHAGKIVAIGQHLAVPAGTVELDLAGKQVTSGLIDCHSHSAISGDVNEGTHSVTAEVRIGDVINSEDVAIYHELAGGLTVANLLHGSANAIGGQNAVVKLRWGAPPAELRFAGAPEGIKFALGENPKQSNWNVRDRRFPQTRMGVEQTIRERFLAAIDYRKSWEEYRRAPKDGRTPPRRDFQLDAIVEILEGKRLVHAHSYRADEILMLIDLADRFGFRIATFQHVLEGYKVADEIARHGAGGSGFSDWWAYKYEVIDAIPWNGAILHDRGVVASFNSDSDELARRLNLEAAKAVRYGGLSEVEALKFVTLNSAKQLGISDHVGSLEVGKDADFVVWSGSPLSSLALAEQTWIDGRKYFDRAADLAARDRLAAERQTLLARLSASAEKPASKPAAPASATPFTSPSGTPSAPPTDNPADKPAAETPPQLSDASTEVR